MSGKPRVRLANHYEHAYGQQEDQALSYQRNLDRLRNAAVAKLRAYEEELAQERSRSRKLELSVKRLEKEIEQLWRSEQAHEELAQERSRSRKLELSVKRLEKEIEQLRRSEQAHEELAGGRHTGNTQLVTRQARNRQAGGRHTGNTQLVTRQARNSLVGNGHASNGQASAKLISYFQQGQRNFLDIQNQATASAALAFLIQHALVQLMTAHASGDAVKERVMMVNLDTIARKLQQYQGVPLRGFKAALGELEKIGGGKPFAADFQRSPDRHIDEKLFQTYLKHLRDHAWIDLVPYYYDIDEHDRVYGFG